MILQWTIVIVVGLAAVIYLARSSWRTWASKNKGCGGSCGCKSSAPSSATPTIIPLQQLRLRTKNDESH